MRRTLVLCACVQALVPTRRLSQRRRSSLRAFEAIDAAHGLVQHLHHVESLPTTLQAASDVSGLDAERAIDALGRDIFAFLAASVLVVPASRLVGAPPVLGFLAIGCILGPHGLGVFGRGWYFSKYATHALHYTAGGGCVLLAEVAVGNTETDVRRDTGRGAPSAGFDSMVVPGRRLPSAGGLKGGAGAGGGAPLDDVLLDRRRCASMCMCMRK